jgi:hypothetical protein
MKETLLALEHVTQDLSRYFKDSENQDTIFSMKYSLILALVFSEIGNKRRADCRLQDA